MDPCRRPGCLGKIEAGYCNHCGHEPAAQVPEAGARILPVPGLAGGTDVENAEGGHVPGLASLF